MTKKQIKMRLVDYWKDDSEANFYDNWLVQLLQEKYDIVYSKTPDFVIYSCYGMEHLKYDCMRIAICLENMRIDWNVADYGIEIASFMDFGERYMRIPYFCIAKNELRTRNKGNTSYDFSKRKLDKREKFCAYMVSNGGAMLRERFFDKLSAYKRVDSGGKWRNNIGGLLDLQYDNKKDDMLDIKQKWLEGYKFNICFENSSYPGYLTEKLFDAYNAGCIPIYWGDTSLRVGFDGESYARNGGGQALLKTTTQTTPNLSTRESQKSPHDY